jgi:hypothetical protein
LQVRFLLGAFLDSSCHRRVFRFFSFFDPWFHS